MATLTQTAAMSLMQSHASVGLRHNLSVAVAWARGSSLRSNKPGGAFFAVPSSFRPGNSVDVRQTPACNSSMSFNNGSTADAGFSENDEDYIDSSVLEAVEVKSGPEGFMIKMKDGHFVKCVHNKPDGSHLPDYGPQPAIVLRMDDASSLLLPIIVLELPSTMLIEAVRSVQVARPTVYQVMKEMVDLMGYQAKLVRVTRRVHEAYYARLYLAKEGDEKKKIVSLDLRPSDAINLAVRCKIPIQVNRELAYGDGVLVVSDPARLPSPTSRSNAGPMLTELDRPEADSCAAAEEFLLVRSMVIAAVEERYSDAAKLRDELRQLRSKKGREQKQT